MKKHISIFLILLLSVNIGSAYFWDVWIPKPLQSSPIINPESQFNPFLLNTPSNIQTLNREMNKAHIYSVKVMVGNTAYYAVYNEGAKQNHPVYDAQIRVTKRQAQEVVDMLKDGDVSWIDRVRIGWIIK